MKKSLTEKYPTTINFLGFLLFFGPWIITLCFVNGNNILILLSSPPCILLACVIIWIIKDIIIEIKPIIKKFSSILTPFEQITIGISFISLIVIAIWILITR